MALAVEFYKEFGDLGYLANYSNHGFIKNKVFYKTVEHFYQSEKFSNKDLKSKIINCDTPKEASNIGRDRNNIRVNDFTSKKINVMREGVYLKFSQNSDIRSKLIETGNRKIKEMSLKESYWGVGPLKHGENNIGLILMSVRDQLKLELRDKIISKCKGKKVYVIGHKKPDCDSVFSSVILTRVLNKMGVNAVCAVRDKNFVDYDLINDYTDEDVCEINNYNNKSFILVDHNNLDGIDNKNVIGSFDHHRISGEVEDLIEIEYASTCLLIYDLFKDIYHFTNDDKLLIGLSVLSDTEFLTSSRFSSYDRKLYNELGLDLDIDYLKKKYLTINNNLDDIESNFKYDYKEYNYNGKVIHRCLIKSYSSDRELYMDKYISLMKKNKINLLIWCDYQDKSTYICFKDLKFKFIYFTTSTYLVLDYLTKMRYL